MQVYAAIRAETLADVAKEVEEAEELGFDGVALPELKLDPFLASVLASEHSLSLKIATAIAVAFPRSPMTTAYMAWALQTYSSGRFELGLDTQVKGHNERRFSVLWDSPGPRLREYVQSLRAIWERWQKGSDLDFRGKFYTFTLMTPEFDPGPQPHPHIPISISAVNPYNLRLAGEICDGIHLHGCSTFKYDTEVALPNMEKGAHKAGRSLKEVEVTGGGFLIPGQNQEELDEGVEEVRRRISFYASTRTYKPVMDIHGWGETTLELHHLSLAGRWKEMPHLITDEIVEAFATIGTYNRIPDLVKKRYGGWATKAIWPLAVKNHRDREKTAQAVKAIRFMR